MNEDDLICIYIYLSLSLSFSLALSIYLCSQTMSKPFGEAEKFSPWSNYSVRMSRHWTYEPMAHRLQKLAGLNIP